MRNTFGDVGSVCGDFACDDALFYIIQVRKSQMLCRRYVAQESSAVHGRNCASDGSGDVVVARCNIGHKRAEDIERSAHADGLLYFHIGRNLIHRTDAEKFKTFDDLKNQRLAVQIGTTGADKAKDIQGAKVSSFNTTSEAFMDLLSHNASAVVLDRPVLAYYLKNQPKADQQLTIPPYIADAEEFGFCVKKGNTALLDKLNKAYAELKASGEVDKIYKKWFQE